MVRRELDQRRYSETRDIEFPRRTGRMLQVTAGFYGEGIIGEVFIAVDKKAGSGGDIAGRDIAVLISLALQNGAPLETMFHATMKDHEGKPEGLAGIVLGEMIQWEAEKRGQ